jgi:hypothetical protein
MNLMVVSEKHGLLIVGVDHLLYVYRLDPLTSTIPDVKQYKKINLMNEDVSLLGFINSLIRKISITCN